MPRNGAGTYALPQGNPVTTGTTISSTTHNNTLSDIATALSDSLAKDGQTAMTGNLPMAGNKVTGLGNATATGDALTFAQLFSQGQQQDVPAAATTDIGAQLSTLINVTGAATITSFGTNYNGPRFLRFADVCTLTNSASLVLPGGANITTEAGDSAIVVPLGNPATGWRVVVYERASGSVYTTGDQTIAGVKTFTSQIVASGGTLTGTLIFGGAASPNTQTIQFGDGSGWVLRYMTSVSGTPTERFRFVDTGDFTATGNITAGGNVLVTSNINAASYNGGQLAGMRNLLINGNFQINQRGYASGTNVGAANTYTLDRWRVVTSGQNVTFTASGNGNQITAPAGGIEQVIEGINIGGGTYVLNWTGTATATVNDTARAKGESFTLPTNTNATVRLIGGTASQVQLEPGTVPTPFEHRPIGAELALCQRYFEVAAWIVTTDGSSGAYQNIGAWKVTKRAEPTVTTASATGGSFASVGDFGFRQDTNPSAFSGCSVTGSIEL